MGVTARTEQQVLAALLYNAKRDADGCLICHLKPNAKGYIPVQPGGRGGKKLRANRFVWSMKYGPIPEHMQVCHSCDKRACIDIEHLFLGTGQDNTNDMVAKNRVARLGRPAISNTVLKRTKELVDQGFTHREVANIMGLSSKATVAFRLRKLHEQS